MSLCRLWEQLRPPSQQLSSMQFHWRGKAVVVGRPLVGTHHRFGHTVSTMDSTTHPNNEIDENVWNVITADPVRGEVLELLYGSEGPLSLADLAIELARETDTELDDMEWSRAKQLRSTLHHRHVPKLQYVGLVAFDPDRMTVSLTQEATPTATAHADSSGGTT